MSVMSIKKIEIGYKFNSFLRGTLWYWFMKSLMNLFYCIAMSHLQEHYFKKYAYLNNDSSLSEIGFWSHILHNKLSSRKGITVIEFQGKMPFLTFHSEELCSKRLSSGTLQPMQKWLKFIYFEKSTKFEEISLLFLKLLSK